MGPLLSDPQVQQYRRDGYLCPVRVLAPEEAARYRGALEAAEAADGGSLPGAYRHKPHLVYTWAQELIRHPKILDAVEALIGPDILAWELVFFDQGAADHRLHQLAPGHHLLGARPGGRRSHRLAGALPSTPESGCMRVVPGTHQREVVAHKDTFGEHNMLSRGQEIAVEVDEDHAVDLVLQPGEMSLHHVKMFHGSHHNRARDSGAVPVHARRVPEHVPRPAVDDAPVRRVRDGGGDQRALPLPARSRADGPLDGVRHAVADGP